AGLSEKHPFLAAAMSVFMLSLAGIPPFAGFFGKYYLFAAAVQSGFTWLAIVGVLTSLVSIYYYLRLIMVMYFKEAEPGLPFSPSLENLAVLVLAAGVLLGLGIFSSSLL